MEKPKLSHKERAELRRKLGLCTRCGIDDVRFGARMCVRCRKYLRQKNREHRGYKAWQPGGRGHAPLEHKKPE